MLQNPNWRDSLDAVRLFIGGKEIEKVKIQSVGTASIKTEDIYDLGTDRLMLHRYGAAVITHDIPIKIDPLALMAEQSPRFDIEVKNTNYCPPTGRRLPKNKRLRKKWRKKYTRIIQTKMFQGCEITACESSPHDSFEIVSRLEF